MVRISVLKPKACLGSGSLGTLADSAGTAECLTYRIRQYPIRACQLGDQCRSVMPPDAQGYTRDTMESATSSLVEKLGYS